jgi:hypothetical protein
MSLLERIRSKPPHVRGQYAFWFSVSVTAVVAVIWATTIPARFSHTTISLEVDAGKDMQEIFAEAKDQVANTITAELQNIEAIDTADTRNMQQFAIDMAGTSSTTEEDTGENVGVSSTTAQNPAVTTSEESASTTRVTEPAPAPRVILIGTTTTQKSE